MQALRDASITPMKRQRSDTARQKAWDLSSDSISDASAVANTTPGLPGASAMMPGAYASANAFIAANFSKTRS